MAPVSFENGSVVEIHGKLFEDIGGTDITYYDDVGIPNVAINITFGGLPIVTRLMTGNSTTRIEPFLGTGNGTFQFTLFIDMPAGAHELVLEFDGWVNPTTQVEVYTPLTYRTVVCVSHPVAIDMVLSPDPVTVGSGLTIRGTLADDTGGPVGDVPLQIWFKGQLLGPTAEGVYIDDVEVEGANFTEDFEGADVGGWSIYSVYYTWAVCQWQWGEPEEGVGPPSLPGNERLWGTKLDGDYERDAWSFLVSPPIDLGDGDQYTLRFHSWWSLVWGDDSGYVLVSVDGGLTWDEDHSIMFTAGSLRSGTWRTVEHDLDEYAGSDDVRIAFVFRSANKSVDTGSSSSFEYVHEVRLGEEAAVHQVVVTFKGDLFHRQAITKGWVVVKRMARIVFEPGDENRTGYRNEDLIIKARLIDNVGKPLKARIDGRTHYYTVNILWKTGLDTGKVPSERLIATFVPDPATGEIQTWFMVGSHELLGPASITIEFPGGEFYTNCSTTEDYRVKAHLYVRVPPMQNRSFYRGQTVALGAELRIVPSESIEDTGLGDLVSNEVVNVFWNGQQINSRRDGPNYLDIDDYLVPRTHEYGDVNVTFEYMGSSIYEPFTQSVEYTIVSDTYITMTDKRVTKGDWVNIDGVILDDVGEPVPNAPVWITWKRAPEIGRATSDMNGMFSLQYYIEYEDKVGNVTVTARFGGNSIYMASDGTATYSVGVDTILERRDRTYSVRQGDQLRVSAKLFEDWGGIGGAEVQRKVVSLIIDGEVVETKRTAFDGSVTFTVLIDPSMFAAGEVELVLVFDGSEHHRMSVTRSTLFIRSDMLISMTMELDGRSFDPLEDVAQYGSELQGRVVALDMEGHPLTGREISVYYVREGSADPERLLVTGRTNGTGEVGFYHPLLDEASGYISLVVLSPGLPEDARPKYTFSYIVPPAPAEGDLVNVIGDRTVEANSDLDLRLEVLQEGRWTKERLTFSLVSPPEGMDISPSGQFSWTPTEEQVGRHEVTVWLYDGHRSETTVIVVTVTEENWALEVMLLAAIGAALVCAVALMVLRMNRARKKDSG